MAFYIWRWAVDPPSTGCDFHTPRCTFDVHYRPFTNNCLNLTLCAVDSPTGLLYSRLSDSARRTFYRFDEVMALDITIHVPLESPLWNPPPRGSDWGSVKVYECAIISSRVLSYRRSCSGRVRAASSARISEQAGGNSMEAEIPGSVAKRGGSATLNYSTILWSNTGITIALFHWRAAKGRS